MCVDQGMGIAPWGAVGQGKYKSAEEIKNRKEEVRYGGQTDEEVKISGVLEKVAKEIGNGVSLQAVALAWASEFNKTFHFSVTPLTIPLSSNSAKERLPPSDRFVASPLPTDQVNSGDWER